MIALENILSQEIIQKLGWTLLHFIWQAAGVALFLVILLRLLRKSTANLRYIFACLALSVIVILPVITRLCGGFQIRFAPKEKTAATIWQLAISGDRVCYARALTSMEEIRAAYGRLAVAAGGSNLFKRIYRLLGKNSTEKTSLSWIPAATAILLTLALVIPTTIALTAKSNPQQAVPKTDSDSYSPKTYFRYCVFCVDSCTRGNDNF